MLSANDLRDIQNMNLVSFVFTALVVQFQWSFWFYFIELALASPRTALLRIVLK